MLNGGKTSKSCSKVRVGGGWVGGGVKAMLILSLISVSILPVDSSFCRHPTWLNDSSLASELSSQVYGSICLSLLKVGQPCPSLHVTKSEISANWSHFTGLNSPEWPGSGKRKLGLWNPCAASASLVPRTSTDQVSQDPGGVRCHTSPDGQSGAGCRTLLHTHLIAICLEVKKREKQYNQLWPIL